MRVLVTGSREYKWVGTIHAVLRGLRQTNGGTLHIIEGGAKGADAIARAFSPDGVVHHTIYAEWDKYGKAAGHLRNTRLLKEGEPDIVFAFKDNFDHSLSHGGTENMVSQAIDAGVATYLVQKMN